VTAPKPSQEDTVTLADGRKLGWAEYGEREGRPVLWFHGTPGARRQVPPDAGPVATKRGLRLLSVERPGAGSSTPRLYGAIRDWADDIAEFAQQLELDRYACVGLSGGGPYALACAHELPESVSVVAVLGGLGPTVGPEAAPGYTRALAYLGPLLRAGARPASWAVARALGALRPSLTTLGLLYARFGPKSDRPILQNPRMMEVFLDAFDAGLEGDYRAPVYDLVLFAQRWGFELADIEVPIQFWQGEEDAIVPLSHSDHQAALVANSCVMHIPGFGHFAGYAEIAQVFDKLIEGMDSEAAE
jgi:pimeloyl-ACP methyl ester carboxylesterase